MEQRYLLDTNILIYYIAEEIPDNEINKIENIINTSFNISIISEIEILGYNKLTEKEIKNIENFLGFANIISLNNELKSLIVQIMRENKIKLPDAVIAATAIKNNLILITRNSKDFENINNIRIYNPYDK